MTGTTQPFDRNSEATHLNHSPPQNSDHQPELDPLTTTLAAAASGGATGAAIGHWLGGRFGATVGAVVGGVAGVAVVNETAKSDSNVVGTVVETLKDASEQVKALAPNADYAPPPHVNKTFLLDRQDNLVLPAKDHHQLGVMLARQGKLEDAIEEFHQTLNLDPDFAAAYYNLGVALSKQGRLPQALEYLWESRQLCVLQEKMEAVRKVDRAIERLS